jgi:uncharacterized membrane protein (UPF0127 family)
LRRLLTIAAGLLWSASLAAADECRQDRVEIRGDWGRAQFSVEIADDQEERARGLMHRERLASSAGMLFLYDAPQRLSFWMRNTLIELDIIFIDPRGVVQYVHERAQPLDETAIFGGGGLIAALEINGGLAQRLGIEEGSEVRHPFFGPDAAWPC